MKTFAELEPNDCRYPFGDGPFVFCGDPQHLFLRDGKMVSSPYCKPHHFLCSKASEKQEAA